MRAILAAVIVVYASLVVATAQVRERDNGWMVPPNASAKQNPLANRPDAAAGGAKLFQERCATCHGADARGTEDAPDLSQADVQAQTDGALFWKISTGNSRSGMPAFSFLPELQRWQLVLHLRQR
ncbi:MAG: cytochrome c class I [Acidobacteria bacterium]|nr:MAG: cytochrome c class I [Acidobacteriota bacterium]PYQ82683.1 MAG: cytochrome c class I [Acidobacteriota bacterium]PYQ91473.1 MAG: cytochrome c class I [Acidobacteriota bacterium]PYR05351.1 MAG: cytochrome c class I [Acidobacteriota bacterium]